MFVNFYDFLSQISTSVLTTLVAKMLFAPIRLEVTYAHANLILLETRLGAVSTLMNAQLWKNLAATMQSARTLLLDTTASVLKDTVQSLTPRLHVNRLM